MKTKDKKLNYVEWLNADVMHEASQKWLSELEFIKDELSFFDDLIKSYTLPLIDSKHFEESKKMVDKLTKFHTKTDSLIKKVKIHERGLKIMVDGIDQPEAEQIYKAEHRGLVIKVSEFFAKDKAFKTQLFELIKNIIKEQKQKLLLQ